MNPSRSRARLIWISAVCTVAVCSSLASADSLQLRNGRHLQGKYVGGSTTMIGFMTSGAVEYFQTSDVLAIMFDNNAETSGNGLQPNHRNSDSSQLKSQFRTMAVQRARCYSALHTAPNRSPNED